MKKSIALLSIIVLLLSMVACGNEKEKAEKYCWNCGEGISKAVSFCGYCGAAVKDNQSEETGNTDDSTDTTIATNEAENTEQPTHTHSYNKTVTAATCTENGYTTYTCACGDTYTDNQTAAQGHSYTQTITPPTCTEKGYTTYACTCGATYTDNQTAARGHNYNQKVTNPTCLEKGYTTYTCSCGDTYKDNYVDPSHNYINYKCTKCGNIDKSHAYDYLVVWVKENGTTNGGYTKFEYRSDSDTYAISYSAQYNYLCIERGSVSGGANTFTSLALDTYYYGCNYFDSYSNLEMCGYINPNTFTSNTAMSYTRYTGDPSAQSLMVELSRAGVCDLVSWLDWCLKTYNIGMTIKDLGFAAY